MKESDVDQKESDAKSRIKSRFDDRHKESEGGRELGGMKKGGKVRTTGRRKLHRGEMVRRNR